jgi:ABC-2 type transport system ATP-binding protein
MTNAIEIRHLKKVFTRDRSLLDLFSKRRASVTALEDISCDIGEREIFGVLGPNGAGKTTLLKILATLILPTDGKAKVLGYDVVKDEKRIKGLIGLIHSDERSFFWRLTGRQNLEFFSSLFQIPIQVARRRIDELLALVDLEKYADDMFHSYSTGMKQRLAIARGLLSNPRILFMDEAMRSIDPISTQRLRDFIRNKALEIIDGAVIIATNRLDEAAALCDRIAILNKGRIVACGSIEEIEAYAQNPVQYELDVKNINDKTIARIRSMKGVRNCEKLGQMNGTVKFVISLSREEDSLHGVLEDIIRSRGYIQKCVRKQLSFEESFNMVIKNSDDHENRDPIL